MLTLSEAVQIRLKEPQRHRALLVDTREGRDQFLECLLADRGIVLLGTYGTFTELHALRSLPEADLLIGYLPAVSEKVCQSLRLALDRFCGPVVIMTETDEPAAVEALIDAGAHSVVCTGTSSDRLRVAAVAAMGTHEKIAELQDRAKRAERALEDRKLIERAKGILMQQRGISEPEALRELQHKSMQRNEPLPQVAATIIAAKELLG